MWQGGHVGSQYHIIIFSRRVYMKIEFSSQMREMLWFLTTNMATVTSRADQQYATCISPIKHLICPPKFYISIVFNFSWDGCNIQEKWKTKVTQNVGRQIRCIMGDVQVAYSPSYSYRWKRGWSWPLCCYVNHVFLMQTGIFEQNFHLEREEVCIKTRSTSASRSLKG